jgi:hypothetical protein
VVDADEVGAEVGDQQELARGIGDGLVGVRGVLPGGDGAGLGETVGLALDGLEGRRGGDLDGAEA